MAVCRRRTRASWAPRPASLADMPALTLEIPFTFTNEYDPGLTEVAIPTSKNYYRIAEDLSQSRSPAQFDAELEAVITKLDRAGVTYTALGSNFAPEPPRLKADAATSTVAHTALYSAAAEAAPDSLVTTAIRFDGSVAVEQALEARDPFSRVTWAGTLKVTWGPADVKEENLLARD